MRKQELEAGGLCRVPQEEPQTPGPVAFAPCSHSTDSYSEARARISSENSCSEGTKSRTQKAWSAASHAAGGTAQKPTACAQHRQAFPWRGQGPQPRHREPDPNPESHRLSCFQIPTGTWMPRKLEGWEGENKRKSLGCPGLLIWAH